MSDLVLISLSKEQAERLVAICDFQIGMLLGVTEDWEILKIAKEALDKEKIHE